ncbi:MAG: hypothetical protein IJ325_02650 [Clostridia bacterium]|nr:hypothetical protein [Clostridia bacterium]
MKKRYIAAGILILVAVLVISENIISSHMETKALREKPYYELYHSYIQRDEQYWVYLMLNDRIVDPGSRHTVFDDRFVADTLLSMHATGFGEYPVVVYMVYPSEALPYGWQKSELNISMNFDEAVFHQNTLWRLIIPGSAKGMGDCTWEEWEITQP